MSGLRRYSDLFGAPGAARVVVASLLGRLPLGMTPLAIILVLRDAGRSYAEAGTVGAAYAVALGVALPVQGRLVDRFGFTPVLVPLAAGYMAVIAALTGLAAADAPLPALFACAIAGGSLLPPLAAAMRVLWPRMLGSPDLRHTAYALEASLQEILFVGGPLLVVALATAVSPSAALLASGALGLTGTLAFALAGPSRLVRGEGRRAGSRLAALRAPGLATIMVVSACIGATFGVFEITLPAFGEQHGNRATGGIALAAFSLGSLVGGLLTGALRPARRQEMRLAAAAAAFALTLVPPLLADSIPAIVALMFLAGVPIAPIFTAAYGLVDDLAPEGTKTESFAWMSTSIALGLSVGLGVAGAAVSHAGVVEALALAVLAGVIGAAAARAGRGRLGARRVRPAGSA